MLIIHPPLTKPCEPPAALAYLAGTIREHGHACHLCDMNIEGLHYLATHSEPAADTWSRRAFKNIERNLQALTEESTYQNRDRYRRAVSDVNRVLEIAGLKNNVVLSLSNYQDNELSPLNSVDLRTATTQFEKNIFYPYFSRRIDELIDKFSPNHIGFSINYLSQTLTSFAMIGYLKAKFPKVKIIIGGGLVTTWLSHPNWKNPFEDIIDTCIGGKGEQPLLNLLHIKKKDIHFQPNYRDLQANNYLSPGFILPYASSSGCFWKKCAFCPETAENSPYTQVPPKQTISDLHKLCDDHKPSLVHLLDNAVSASTMRAIVSRPLPSKWYGFARFDKLLTDMDFCLLLKKSGCVMLKLGLESGDQQVLNAMNKGIDLRLAEQVLSNLHSAGIATYIYLLFGTPAEDEACAHKTLKFVEAHHRAITFLNLAIFNLPLYSSESTNLEISDFYQGDLSIYQNFKHPKSWNRKDIRRFLESQFKRSPDVSPIVQNNPPFFTSNHAPFFSTNFCEN